MTTTTHDAEELVALRELADDIFERATEPVLDAQLPGLEFDPQLWSNLAESGLTLLTAPESLGGSGAGLAEMQVVLEASGYHAAPVPIAENDLLAAWLLQAADLPLDSGPMTAASTCRSFDGGRLIDTLVHVPWAANVDTVVVVGPDYVAALRQDQMKIDSDPDLAGQAYARVHVDADVDAEQYRSTDSDLSGEFRLRGALARATQTCGALTRALELSCQHVTEREQFGRPLAKFQAVQALIAESAGRIAVAKTSAAFAGDVATNHGFSADATRFAVAVAKIESARAAGIVSRNAHQAHGAIGFTLDHRLRHFTTRAQAWRSEFGSQRYWQEALGNAALSSGRTAWELVTELSRSSLRS